MGKKISLSTAIFLILCAVLVTFQITLTHLEKKYSSVIYDVSNEGSSFSKINSIDDIARKYYIGEINENDLETGLINGYLLGLGDKYASYMDAEEFASYTSQSNGKQIGIGITVIYDSTLRGMYVTSVTKDSPASSAGLVAGDIITQVDGKTIAEMGYYNTLSYMGRGNEGDAVTLLVEKGPDYHQQRTYVIQRSVINSYTVSHRMFKDNVGYVQITGFNKVTPVEFKNAVTELISQGAEAFIFDVRNNGGGDLESIKGVLDYLLPEGPILRVISKDGNESVHTSDASSIDLPMTVVMNGNTASAAELFASALRDYGKAKLVGTKTYGKGTVQTITRLTDGSALLISTEMYNPPYSDNYEGIGLVPDVEIDLTKQQYDKFYLLTLEDDPQINAAFNALDIAGDSTEADGDLPSEDSETADNGESTDEDSVESSDEASIEASEETTEEQTITDETVSDNSVETE